MRKPRAKAKLSSLPPGQIAALTAWLTVNNLTYKQAVAKVKSEFGVTTNTRRLCDFFQRHCAGQIATSRTTILEIVADVSQPGIVSLKILTGQGVKVKGDNQ